MTSPFGQGMETLNWIKNNTFTSKEMAEIWERKLEKKIRKIKARNIREEKKGFGKQN